MTTRKEIAEILHHITGLSKKDKFELKLLNFVIQEIASPKFDSLKFCEFLDGLTANSEPVREGE
jgi:hypothetical protein